MKIDCIPEAPVEWPRCVFADLAEVNPLYPIDKQALYPFVEMASVAENFAGITRFDSRRLEGSGFSRFKLNDTLFGKITPCPENGKVALVRDLPGKCGLGSTEFIVLSPRNGNDPRFVHALACSHAVLGRAVAMMEGSTGRLRVREDTFTKWLWVPVPGKDEQKGIADVLDAADDAIRSCEGKLVAARQLKTALMQQLFTRGLPGRHTRFQETKIGRIPEGWEVIRLQRVLDGAPFNGVSPPSRSEPPGTPILNVSCIEDGKCDPRHVTYVDVDAATFNECRARKGDFYVLRGNGNREYCGIGGLLAAEPDPPCIFSDKLIRLRFKREFVHEGFIPYMWQSRAFLDRFQAKAESGSGLWMMSKRDIRREYFAKPNLGEQEEIVALLKSVDEVIATAESESAALQRLKTSLLQNLLTGKVRVKVEDGVKTAA